MTKITFLLNSKITSLEAVYSTCYTFIDKFYIYLDKNSKNIIVTLQSKEDKKINLRKAEGEFRNELLNNLLREEIAKNNSKIREYIISQALYSAIPTETDEFMDQIEEDYLDDPLGIAIPWEDKPKKKAKPKTDKKKSSTKTGKSK
ncbi:MAG: His-Xaa-Ser system protein HxsD [Spirochaetes bacterium]|nr:His-Xaa-Ser system protein HxsD [Spirochaetota bacterium]